MNFQPSPKPWHWPGQARLALSVVVNVEEGAEGNVADGDKYPEPVDEMGIALKRPVFIVNLMIMSWGTLLGVFLAPYVFGLFWRRTSTAGVYAGMGVGLGSALVLFPEMDNRGDVPEISLACWGILGKRPDQMMCAHSRMVVKRKAAEKPVVLPCTLLPYQPAFDMGPTLADAARAHGGMFDKGAVKLCHPHCAKFCVLGGGSCS